MPSSATCGGALTAGALPSAEWVGSCRYVGCGGWGWGVGAATVLFQCQISFLQYLHCKKGYSDIPVPILLVTYQTLPGQELFKLFPPRESLVSDIPAGDGNVANFFLWCVAHLRYEKWTHGHWIFGSERRACWKKPVNFKEVNPLNLDHKYS